MTVAIFTGSRKLSHSDDDLRFHVRDALLGPSVAFVGCCPTGLDFLVRDEHGFEHPEVYTVRARWDTEGRSAGPKRNSRMVKAAAALAEALGVELVCHAWPLGESRGTRDCMRKAEAAGARVVVHTPEVGES